MHESQEAQSGSFPLHFKMQASSLSVLHHVSLMWMQKKGIHFWKMSAVPFFIFYHIISCEHATDGLQLLRHSGKLNC